MIQMSGPVSGHYGVQMGQECVAHSHSGWVPLEWHHVFPLGDGGPDIKANQIRVCANAHYSIHAVLDHLLKRHRAGLDPDWAYLQHFSPTVRTYARNGFEQILASQA